MIMSEDTEMNGYISPNGLWAAVPYGKRYISIYNGEQICLHNTLETAKKFIQKQNRKSK
jgi:hypothetical protein